MSEVKTKVLVIGGGVSGIAAATHFLKNQFESFTIVEAENRTGGRIHSFDFFDHVIELGAQWCHGEVDNKVYEIVKNRGLLRASNVNFASARFYTGNGNILDKSVGDKLFNLCHSLSRNNDLLKDSNKSFAVYFVENYYDYLEKSEYIDGICIDSLAKILFIEYYKKFEMSVDGSNDWFDISAQGLLQYRECEGNSLLEWGDHGYKTLLDILTDSDAEMKSKLEDRLILNKIVKKIDYNNDLIEVTYWDDAKSYHEHVISTVSLGVLQKFHETLFEPKLSERKTVAIENLGFGTVNKIFLKFDSKWWNEEADNFGLIWNEHIIELFKDKYPFYFNENKFWFEDVFHFYELANSPETLIGWIAGPDCDKICDLSDNILIEICTEILEAFTGLTIPKPIDVARSRWGTNDNFLGSYSYRSVDTEATNTSAAILAEPILAEDGVKPKILFAGEATHSHYYSTVHGALETGIREADRLLNYFQNKFDKITVNNISLRIYVKVIIIGAGICGLGASNRFQNANFADYLILEAQNYVGGRIKSESFGDSVIELGAQWLHGTRNQLFEEIEHLNLVQAEQDCEGCGLFVNEHGFVCDSKLIEYVDFEVGKILYECEQLKSDPCCPIDVSVEKILIEKLLKTIENDDLELRKWKKDVIDWHLRFQVIDNSCEYFSHVSAKQWGEYESTSESDNTQAHFVFKNGYQSLIDQLTVNDKIRLNTPVKNIDWSQDKVHVSCDNNVEYVTDHVIVTASLGYLKNHLDTLFNPKLPPELSNYIRKSGFYGINKIFLQFETQWWNCAGFQLLFDSECSEYKNCWLRDLSGFDVVPNTNMLLGWIGGLGAKIVEDIDEKDVGIACVDLLRRFLKDPSIPYPKNCLRTKWLSNEWICGSYSFRAVNNVYEDLQNICYKNEKPSVIVSGEGMHLSHYSTTHGASEAGIQAADTILNYTGLENLKATI